MQKDARRDKRKEKERLQTKRREAAVPKPFDNKKQPYRHALLRLYQQARIEYPSLVRVEEIDCQLSFEPQEGLDKSGLGKRYKTVFFTTVQDDGYSEFKPNHCGNWSMGGHTQAVTNPQGNLGTVVFMKRRNDIGYSSDIPNIALFLHELGHVDDITKRLNWSADKPVDLEEM